LPAVSVTFCGRRSVRATASATLAHGISHCPELFVVQSTVAIPVKFIEHSLSDVTSAGAIATRRPIIRGLR
jgi:hypothetical protein